MHIIKENSLYNLWLKSLKLILESGDIIEDDKENVKEILNLYIQTENLTLESEDFKIWNNESYIKISESQDMFDYKKRITNFNNTHQFEIIKNKLKNTRYSKSATTVTIFPEFDKSKIPCLVSVDFKIRNNQLQTTAFFRSQDVWKKQFNNYKLLVSLMDEVSNYTAAPIGTLSLLITSAHIYGSDINDIYKLINIDKI